MQNTGEHAAFRFCSFSPNCRRPLETKCSCQITKYCEWPQAILSTSVIWHLSFVRKPRDVICLENVDIVRYPHPHYSAVWILPARSVIIVSPVTKSRTPCHISVVVDNTEYIECR
eukprot:1784242-Pleurochrysis_carterae.AAC.1